MPLIVTETTIGNILTRTGGYLRGVTSHSLQPYRGCTFGSTLCGVGCYVQHSLHLLKGRRWGEFLEVRTNSADSYRSHYARESRWSRRNRQGFSIFLSSATDPYLPHEMKYGVTRQLLEAMLELPPDQLILQTHSPRILRDLDLLLRLRHQTRLRVHLSIESDQEQLPNLPPAAHSVAERLECCATLHDAGIAVVVTVAPLLPIADPETFFQRISTVADGVVIDHFVEGDGSADGARTLRTPLPAAMRQLDPASVSLDYRERMVSIARRIMPGRVGVGGPGFAGARLSE